MTIKDAIRCNIQYVRKPFWPAGFSWELPLKELHEGNENALVLAHTAMGAEWKDPVRQMDDQEIDWEEAKT